MPRWNHLPRWIHLNLRLRSRLELWSRSRQSWFLEQSFLVWHLFYNDTSENPNLRLQSRLELWSRSWHGWFLEQIFLVRNLFYNNTFGDVPFRGLDGDRKSSRCLPNTGTFVPNDHSQCLHCVLPIMRCAFGDHLDVGLAEWRTPCRFVGNLMFPSLFFGEDGHLW